MRKETSKVVPVLTRLGGLAVGLVVLAGCVSISVGQVQGNPEPLPPSDSGAPSASSSAVPTSSNQAEPEWALQEPCPNLTPSAEIAGKGFMQGIVTSDGKPVAGALVILQAWPNEKSLAKAKVGDAIDVAVVAKTLSADDGTFELKLTDSKPLERRRIAGGKSPVNFDVVAQTMDGKIGTWSFSAGFEASGSTIVAIDPTEEFPLTIKVT